MLAVLCTALSHGKGRFSPEDFMPKTPAPPKDAKQLRAAAVLAFGAPPKKQ